MEHEMTTTPAEIARKHRDLHEKRADARAAETGIERARAKAWATFEHAVNGLAKHGCLDTVTITDTEQADEPDSTELEQCDKQKTVKVGDELQEVVAADLPVGTQIMDCDGDYVIVTINGLLIQHATDQGMHDRTGNGCAPYTITYVPPTVPEPIMLDRLPVGMAEGSAVLSSEAGVMIYMSDDAGCCGPYWRDWQEAGWGTPIKPDLGTLTLLHDAGARVLSRSVS